MLELNLYSIKGKIVGQKGLPDKMFKIEPNDSVIYEAVRMYRSNKRSGTASTKTKGEVRGGGRKPWRQKHTGRARAGSIRSPLWPGGGTTFGPKPRDYYYRIPHKKLKLAFFSSLSYKAKEGKIILVDKLTFPEPKTKLFKAMLGALGLDSFPKNILFVSAKIDDKFHKAGRNIKGMLFKDAKSLNAYDVLCSDTIVFSSDGLESLSLSLGKEVKDKEEAGVTSRPLETRQEANLQ